MVVAATPNYLRQASQNLGKYTHLDKAYGLICENLPSPISLRLTQHSDTRQRAPRARPRESDKKKIEQSEYPARECFSQASGHNQPNRSPVTPGAADRGSGSPRTGWPRSCRARTVARERALEDERGQHAAQPVPAAVGQWLITANAVSSWSSPRAAPAARAAVSSDRISVELSRPISACGTSRR